MDNEKDSIPQCVAPAQEHLADAKGSLKLGLLFMGCPVQLIEEVAEDLEQRIEKCRATEITRGWVNREEARSILLGRSSAQTVIR